MKDYALEKREKKKAALKVVWIIGLLGVVFLIIVSRFALAGDDDMFSSAPTNNEVYAMAKIFVKPTLKAANAIFQASGYKFDRARDSVYVIRSYVETKDNTGVTEKTNFEIVLKYKGGSTVSQDNWEVLNLNED